MRFTSIERRKREKFGGRYENVDTGIGFVFLITSRLCGVMEWQYCEFCERLGLIFSMWTNVVSGFLSKV